MASESGTETTLQSAVSGGKPAFARQFPIRQPRVFVKRMRLVEFTVPAAALASNNKKIWRG